jgi:YggT family protein
MVAYAGFIDVLRTLLFWLAFAVGAVCLVDWMVRTRRIGPFSPVARFMRRYVDPLMVPVERRIVRAGGLPASAPWWTLAAVVVGGILAIQLLAFGGGVAMRVSHSRSPSSCA